jgi:hypothetical protein
MAKKATQDVLPTGYSAERRALKLLHRLGGLFSEMALPWDTEVRRCIPSLGMDRDDNAAMVEYVASVGFSGDALSLARAIKRVYAFADDNRLWPARSDKEGWKKMQPWVDSLRYHASVVAGQCVTIHRLIRNTMPKTPLSKGGGKGAVKRRGGRKKDPKVQSRNKKIGADFRKGLDVDAVCDKYSISKELARRLKSDLGKADNTAENRQS